MIDSFCGGVVVAAECVAKVCEKDLEDGPSSNFFLVEHARCRAERGGQGVGGYSTSS